MFYLPTRNLDVATLVLPFRRLNSSRQSGLFIYSAMRNWLLGEVVSSYGKADARSLLFSFSVRSVESISVANVS